MDGKTVVVTGASAGIGLVTACRLAELGATVALVCRDPKRGMAALQQVTEVAGAGAPELFIADLSSQSDVRAVASQLRRRFSMIDVLVNNVGAAFPKRSVTVDGIERTLATNHLAPFLLTNLILDRIVAAPAGRIVNLTSEIHAGTLDFDNLQGERSYKFFPAYARSKLCNVLFTYELARRLAETRVTCNCVTPGPTLSDFGRGERGMLRFMRGMMHVLKTLGIASDVERGARTSIYLAASHDVADITAGYFMHLRARRSKPITYDAAVAKKLWDVSEALVGAVGTVDAPAREMPRTH